MGEPASCGIQLSPFLKGLAVYQADVVPVFFQQGGRGYQDIDREWDAEESGMQILRCLSPGCAFRHDDQHIDVAVRPHLAAGGGAEQDYSYRLHGFNNSPHEFIEFFGCWFHN